MIYLIWIPNNHSLHLNNKFRIQVDSIIMGPPLGPILDEIFFSHHEENWFNKFPIEFKSTFYGRFVSWICVFGDIGLLSFSKHGKYITNVYRKPIVGEVFTIYESFILAYKKEELYHVLWFQDISFGNWSLEDSSPEFYWFV